MANDKATDKVEAFASDAQKAAKDQFAKVSRSLEDIAAFSQDNVEAMLKSSRIAAKALEELNAEIVSFSKKSLEESVAATKELSSVKSLPELVEKQSTYVKTSIEGVTKEITKVNEMYMSAMKDVFEPISARAMAAAEMVKSYRA